MKTCFVHWPSLQEELSPFLGELQGKVLNAGSGRRSIFIPKATEMINMDLESFENVDVVGDLESIPFDDKTFDGVLNVAVLEHVKRPWIVIQELSRVLKRGGKLLCVVPFFQPIHYVPTDYFRFTPDGIRSLLEDAGFKILASKETHSMWHTIGWMLEDKMKDKPAFFRLLAAPFAVFFYLLSKYHNLGSKTFPNAITLIAQKDI